MDGISSLALQLEDLPTVQSTSNNHERHAHAKQNNARACPSVGRTQDQVLLVNLPVKLAGYHSVRVPSSHDISPSVSDPPCNGWMG
jgi:hypothetical protein